MSALAPPSKPAVPHALFQFNAIFNGEVNFFAPAPDGQKLYFAEPRPEDRPESAS